MTPRIDQSVETDGGPPPSPFKQWAFGMYLLILGFVLLQMLVNVFPGRLDNESLGRTVLVDFIGHGWLVASLQPEIRLLVLAAVAGALGSYIHLATSFADFAGARKLRDSWFWWYLLRPFIGAALGLILYVVLRAGLAGDSGAQVISPFGVAAMGGLAGLFSRQATDKLREVFETMFSRRTPDNRTDPLSQTGTGPAAEQKAQREAADKARRRHRDASAADDDAPAER